MTVVALIQQAPVLLDKHETIKKAVHLAELAVANGARLVVFPEAFIPGYPSWIWRLKPGGDWGLYESLHARLLANAIDLSSDDLTPLKNLAKQHNVTLVCGINERDGSFGRSTLYNSMITISSEGELINHHRKLMPTNPERMVWGMGDGRGLNVVDTPAGRLGGLICWENYMPLARQAIYSQGPDIYIAPTYDSGDASIGTMQHIAREGRVWVLCCGVAFEKHDIPDDLPELKALYHNGDDWINPGDSLIVAPGGEIKAGPLHKQKGSLILDIDIDESARARRTLDVAGHYARPDVFELRVNRCKSKPAYFIDEK